VCLPGLMVHEVFEAVWGTGTFRTEHSHNARVLMTDSLSPMTDSCYGRISEYSEDVATDITIGCVSGKVQPLKCGITPWWCVI
jgi:hypothetical protein